MLTTYRKISDIIFIKVSVPSEFIDFLIRRGYKYKSFENDFEFLNSESKDKVIIFVNTDTSESYIYEVETEALKFILAILNSNLKDLVENTKLGPKIIIFDEALAKDTFVEKIQQEIDCIEDTLIGIEDVIHLHREDTMIIFPNSNNQKIKNIDSLSRKYIIFEGDFSEIESFIQNFEIEEILKNDESIKNLNEFEICIDDVFGKQKIHLERVLSCLERIGITNNVEKFLTKCSRGYLIDVPAIEVRFFAKISPIYLKKVLMALEVDSEGNRMCNLDLYCSKNKMIWTSLIEEENFNRTKMCLKFREHLEYRFSVKDTSA